MELEKIIPYLWKTPVFGFALFLGVVIGNFLASQIGLEPPATIYIFSPLTLAIYLLLISPLLLATLLFLCKLLTGNFLSHWLTLSILTWVVYSLGTSAIGVQQDTFLGLSTYMIIIFFFSSFIGLGSAVLLFPEHYKREKKLLIWR
jgi:hypothetical protein